MIKDIIEPAKDRLKLCSKGINKNKAKMATMAAFSCFMVFIVFKSLCQNNELFIHRWQTMLPA